MVVYITMVISVRLVRSEEKGACGGGCAGGGDRGVCFSTTADIGCVWGRIT